MNLSRSTKNGYLILSNALLFFLKLLKLGLQSLNPGEVYWMIAFGLVITFYCLPFKQKLIQTLKHISLFLLSGWALGITIGALLGDGGLLLYEKLWIPFGLITTFLHYSPSSRDIFHSSYYRLGHKPENRSD